MKGDNHDHHQSHYHLVVNNDKNDKEIRLHPMTSFVTFIYLCVCDLGTFECNPMSIFNMCLPIY